MRILHVTNYHRGGGGSDNAWDRTILMSQQRGLDVHLFTKNSNDLPAGITGKIKAFISGVYAHNAKKELQKTISELEPDIVHVHELYPLISPWVLPLCKSLGVKVVMTAYDYRLTCPIVTHHDGEGICHDCLGSKTGLPVLKKNCRGNLAESLAFAVRHATQVNFSLFLKYVDHFVVLNPFSAEWFEEKLGVSADRISVQPCIVDLPDSPVSDPTEGEYVLFAARAAPEKGAELIIEACRKAQLPLRLACKEDNHPAIKSTDHNIRCVMNKDRAELEELYKRARIVVVPSLWYETFGLVAAEASSLGIPVIASNLGALKYTVDHQQTGLLVEAGNVDAWAKTLKDLWGADSLLRKFGKAGRSKMETEFNEEAAFSRLLACYEKVLGFGEGSSS